MEQATLARCQEVIQYQFSDESLLYKALTHASVAPTRLDSNERLEFLGDAVLGMSICASLFNQYEQLQEGEMTKIKSVVVSRKTCAEVVRAVNLQELLFLGKDMSDLDSIPESVAAAVFESIIGAIYLDGGFEPANEFILRHLQPHINEAIANSHQQNYKSLIQQHAQRVSSQTPEYIMLDEKGPDHSKCFEIAVSLDGRHYPSAWGRSKKEAEQAAAHRALLDMGILKEAPDDAQTEYPPNDLQQP